MEERAREGGTACWVLGEEQAMAGGPRPNGLVACRSALGCPLLGSLRDTVIHGAEREYHVRVAKDHGSVQMSQNDRFCFWRAVAVVSWALQPAVVTQPGRAGKLNGSQLRHDVGYPSVRTQSLQMTDG
jgi:hypothetical protein